MGAVGCQLHLGVVEVEEILARQWDRQFLKAVLWVGLVVGVKV